MTTNKQDELRKRVRDSLGVDCWNFSYTKKKKVYPSSTETDLAVKLVRSEVSRVLSELETHKNTAANVNLGLHGRRDCKSCSLVEDLEAFIKAKRKEYESEN